MRLMAARRFERRSSTARAQWLSRDSARIRHDATAFTAFTNTTVPDHVRGHALDSRATVSHAPDIAPKALTQ